MEEGLKQRLVGAIVLVAIAVILLPILLDGPQPSVDEIRYNIPKSPEVAKPDIPTRADISERLQKDTALRAQIDEERLQLEYGPQDVLSEPVGAQAGVQVSSEPGSDSEGVAAEPVLTESLKSATVERAPLAPAESETAAPELALSKAWLIQVGSYSQEKNAQRMVDSLRRRGYRAYYEPKQNVYRVLVGPELKHSRAQRDLAAIKKSFQVEPLLIRYVP